MNYKKSDYAINKFSDGIAYRLATGETIVVTYEDMKIENPNMTPEEFQELKNFSDEDYRASYNNDHKETRMY